MNDNPSILLKLSGIVLLILGILFLTQLTNNNKSKNSYSPPNFTEFAALSTVEQSKILTEIANLQNVQASWKYLVESSYYIKTNPHDLAHLVGATIWQKEGVPGLSICDASFAFGCFHGFAEEALKQDLQKLQSLAESCLLIGKEGTGPWASCIHGLGHGVGTYFRTTDLDSSLKACDTLKSGQQYCQDGVFMEFSINSPSAFWTKSKDLLFPCSSIDDKYALSCGRVLPGVLQKYHNLGTNQIAQTCKTSKNIDVSSQCLDMLGLLTADQANGDVQKIDYSCNQITNKEAKVQCFIAASVELVFQQIPNWQTKYVEVCNKLERDDLQSCIARAQHTAKDYNRQ